MLNIVVNEDTFFVFVFFFKKHLNFKERHAFCSVVTHLLSVEQAYS